MPLEKKKSIKEKIHEKEVEDWKKLDCRMLQEKYKDKVHTLQILQKSEISISELQRFIGTLEEDIKIIVEIAKEKKCELKKL